MTENPARQHDAVRFLSGRRGQTVRAIAKTLAIDLPTTAGSEQTFHVRTLRELLTRHGIKQRLDDAHISVKTVRVGPDGVPFEKMTFPNLSHDELPRESWETSALRTQTRQMLVVVFDGASRDQSILENRLFDSFLWIPSDDEDRDMARDWKKCRDAITYKYDPPKEADTRAVHVGTKGQDSLDFETGRGGEKHKKLCLCLNKKFVAGVIFARRDAAGA